VANLCKRKIKASVTRRYDLGISFDYDGEVTAADSEEILSRIMATHRRVAAAAAEARNPARADALRLFAANLEKSFYGFEPDYFQQNLLRIADDVISQFKASIELWPTLVEICYFEKRRHGLPWSRVANRPRAVAA
jgi:hypothetical protein